MLSRQVTAVDPNPVGDQRLVTVYDQGEEKTFITTRTTIGDALREQNIVIESVDTVEPALNTSLQAKSYAVNIYRARTVIIEDKGMKTQVLTAKKNPKEILASVEEPLYPEDTTTY